MQIQSIGYHTWHSHVTFIRKVGDGEEWKETMETVILLCLLFCVTLSWITAQYITTVYCHLVDSSVSTFILGMRCCTPFICLVEVCGLS